MISYIHLNVIQCNTALYIRPLLKSKCHFVLKNQCLSFFFIYNCLASLPPVNMNSLTRALYHLSVMFSFNGRSNQALHRLVLGTRHTDPGSDHISASPPPQHTLKVFYCILVLN